MAKAKNETTDLICVNEYLVLKKFAVVLKDYLDNQKRDDELLEDTLFLSVNTNEDYCANKVGIFRSTSSLNLTDENDFYDVSNLRCFLDQTNKSPNQRMTLNASPTSSLNPCYAVRAWPANVLVDGFNNIEPILNFEDEKIHACLQIYLRNTGIKKISEFSSFCWPVIFRGRHLFGLANPPENLSFSYVCPLMSLLLEQNERNIKKEYNKTSIERCQNGPFFLVVCSSCKPALRIYNTIKEILAIVISNVF